MIKTNPNKIETIFKKKKNIPISNLSNLVDEKDNLNKPKSNKRIICKNTKEIEEILKKFDLSMIYGPFKGITRIERFERAERFNLNPPKYILDYIKLDEKNTWSFYENEL